MLTHSASSRAVAKDGLKWSGNVKMLDSLDSSEICFNLWKNGIAAPGPTVNNRSYWWVHDAWRSGAIMSKALGDIVGGGWVEAVRRRIFLDIASANLNDHSSKDENRRIFLSHSSTDKLTIWVPRHGKTLGPWQVCWPSWTDDNFMREDDYSSDVIAAVKAVDDIIASVRTDPRIRTRGYVIDSILKSWAKV